MSNNIDIKKLWSGQTATQPTTEELFSKINSLKRKALKRLILTNVVLILTCAFIINIWIKYQPELVTTKIGIVLIVVAMVIFLLSYNRSLPLLKEENTGQSNTDFLKNLLEIKSKQQYLATTMLNVYFILLSVGLALYMFEYTSRMTPFWGIFSYAITFSWVILNWFHFRPKQIKKMQMPVDEMIERIKAINEQFGS
jgi:hypothetical protein